MYKRIIKEIKKYDVIVIARHIGVDPDALASQIALRDSIKLTFPDKKVLAVGTGSAKFNFIGKLDKMEDVSDALLIVLDTPDKKRVDISDISGFKYKIKIDHHPVVDRYCDIELVDEDASSTCEMIMRMIENTKLECNKSIAEALFTGLVSDSNRFLFNTCSSRTFNIVGRYLEEYKFVISDIYTKLYMRPLNEIRLAGYIESNMEVTDNGLAYIKITDDIITKYGVDAASAGNMVNNYNFIEGVLVWATITEDKKNNQFRISIRSRGPIINEVALRYNGGGHMYASGARVSSMDDAIRLMDDLDKELIKYKEEL